MGEQKKSDFDQLIIHGNLKLRNYYIVICCKFFQIIANYL